MNRMSSAPVSIALMPDRSIKLPSATQSTPPVCFTLGSRNQAVRSCQTSWRSMRRASRSSILSRRSSALCSLRVAPDFFPEAFPPPFFRVDFEATLSALTHSSWSRRRFLGALLALDFLDLRGTEARRDIISKIALTLIRTRCAFLAYSQEEWE